MCIVAIINGDVPIHNLAQHHLIWATVPCSWAVWVVNEHMVAAMYSHFALQWQDILGPPKYDELFNKFKRGALDVELLERVRSPTPDLTAMEFRFLKVLQQMSLLRSQPLQTARCDRLIYCKKIKACINGNQSLDILLANLSLSNVGLMCFSCCSNWIAFIGAMRLYDLLHADCDVENHELVYLKLRSSWRCTLDMHEKLIANKHLMNVHHAAQRSFCKRFTTMWHLIVVLH